jgi:hypothetical protein
MLFAVLPKRRMALIKTMIIHPSRRQGKEVKIALEQAMKAQKRSRGIALLFL